VVGSKRRRDSRSSGFFQKQREFQTVQRHVGERKKGERVAKELTAIPGSSLTKHFVKHQMGKRVPIEERGGKEGGREIWELGRMTTHGLVDPITGQVVGRRQGLKNRRHEIKASQESPF